MPTIVIDIDATVSAIVSAYSLKDDAWQDYEYFINQACNESLDDRSKNRALRAAHFNLYAHFEAVVYELGKKVLSRSYRKKSLADRCSKISAVAGLVSINLMGRKVRNEITHPGKSDHIPFLELSFESLQNWSESMSVWLDNACIKLEVSRFANTKELTRNFASHIGEYNEPKEV